MGRTLKDTESQGLLSNAIKLCGRFYFEKKHILILEILVLLLLSLTYLYIVLNYFIVRSVPGGSSDAMYYMDAAIRGTGNFGLIDRIVPVIGLRWSYFTTTPSYLAGAYYILLVNLLIISIAIYWSYARKGLFAGLLVGISLVTSFTFLYNATNVYTDQTMSLFCLIAFIFFFSEYRNKVFDPTLMAGLFTAIACFSKLPGVVILIFFIVWIIYEKKWLRFKSLLQGFLIGSILVITIFVLTYDLVSLWHIIINNRYGIGSFLAEPFTERSLYEYFMRQYCLPVFLPFIILLGAYKNKTTKPLFFAAVAYMAFSLLMSFIVLWYSLTDNYIFPLLMFGSMGWGIYLAFLYDNSNIKSTILSKFYLNRFFKLIFALFCIIVIFICFKLGIENYKTFINLSSPDINQFLLRIYPLVPICMVSLFVLVEYFKSKASISRPLILSLIILISLWCPAYNGSLAYSGVSAVNKVSELVYTAPVIFNEIPANKFSVYVEKWNLSKYADDIPRYYAYFFNEKYPKVHDGNSYFNAATSMFMILNKNEIPNAWEYGDLLLTDAPGCIKQYFPKAEEVQRITWESGYLSLMDLNTDIKKLIGPDRFISHGNNSGGYFFLDRWTATVSGTVQNIKIKCGTSGNVKVAIYADINGSPGVLLNAINTNTSVNAGWNEIAIPTTSIIAGTDYWLAAISDANCIQYTSQAGSVQKYKPAIYSTFNFPNSAGSGFTFFGGYNIIAGY